LADAPSAPSDLSTNAAPASGYETPLAAPYIPRPHVSRRRSTLSTLRVAVLDMNNGVANQGMRCLRQILGTFDGQLAGVSVLWDEFDVRRQNQVPDLRYDVYLCSGGPGSPWEEEGAEWEHKFFALLDGLRAHNADPASARKFAFLICHSFELAVRHWDLCELVPRRSESFGIFPVHPVGAGFDDPIFDGLLDPFMGADFRSWQCVNPKHKAFHALGAEVLAIEKDRPHVELERAVMAIRFTPEIVGTQFHPEADPSGMLLHFRKEQRKETIVSAHGEAKYRAILDQILSPVGLPLTFETILPNFLRDAVRQLQEAHTLEPTNV